MQKEFLDLEEIGRKAWGEASREVYIFAHEGDKRPCYYSTL